MIQMGFEHILGHKDVAFSECFKMPTDLILEELLQKILNSMNF
jgi:hypothetical protein